MSDGKITTEELLQLREQCLQSLRNDELYYLRNDAKLRAVTNTQSYEEFKWVCGVDFFYKIGRYLCHMHFRDIVDAAHLRPITKQDKANAKTKNRLWNSAAPESSI